MDNNKTKYFIGMIVAMLIWGVAWTSGKAAVEHSNAQIASFWRYAISFIGMLPVIWYMKKSLKTDKIAYIYMFIAGVLSAAFSYLFFCRTFSWGCWIWWNNGDFIGSTYYIFFINYDIWY